MNSLEQMVEKRIREHQAALLHVDHLMERAQKAAPAQAHGEVDRLLERRDEMAVYLDQMKLKSVQDWRAEELAKAGPMGVWDALAQQAEALVEKFEH